MSEKKRTYKVVYYLPDNFGEWRVPVGAVYGSEQSSVESVRAGLLPDANCIGSTLRHRLMHKIVDRLSEIERFDTLPTYFGHNVEMSDKRQMPAGVEDPAEWLTSLVLPERPEEFQKDARSQSPRRTREGLNYLSNFGLTRYVRNRYKPPSSVTRMNGERQFIPKVSHGISGKRGLVLMEPVLPERDTWEDQTNVVGERFFGYKQAEENDKFDVPLKKIAYMLPRGPKGVREAIQDKLGGVSEFVSDGSEAMALEMKRMVFDAEPQDRDVDEEEYLVD